MNLQLNLVVVCYVLGSGLPCFLNFLMQSNAIDENNMTASKTIVIVGNSGAVGVGEGDLVGDTLGFGVGAFGTVVGVGVGFTVGS